MNLVFNLSLRNLLRQKRRNAILGIGIAFGMTILVIANSFSHGMVDILLNEVVATAFGHLVIQGEPGRQVSIIRDRQRIDDIVAKAIPKDDIVGINENLGVMVRVIGNGEADNLFLVGVAESQQGDDDFPEGFFKLVEGDFDDYDSKTIKHPVIISEEKARSLNVKANDVLKARVFMVTGEIQAIQMTVIAVANASNTFMNMVLFMEADRAKALMGYKPWESASLQIAVKNPKVNAKLYADAVQKELKPGILSIAGSIDGEKVHVLSFNNDDKSKEIIKKRINIVEGDNDEALDKKGVLVPRSLAIRLGLKPGSSFSLEYMTQHQGNYEAIFDVSAIYDDSKSLSTDGVNPVLMNGERLFDSYNRHLPAREAKFSVDSDIPIYDALATEWKLLERSSDSTTMMKKYKDDRRTRSRQHKLDVVTMYEGASDILRLESALNMITGIVVLVLFFIILIGVVNTLRMTIRERTREIGTIRAIGMQRTDVRNMFIVETLLLTAISCAVGILLGLVVTGILGLIRFDTESAIGMILKDSRLVFKLNPLSLISNFILIMIISGVTAYLPARAAARLSAVEALRHYE